MVFRNIDFHNVAEIAPFEDGWQQSSFIIRNDATDITISKPDNLAQMKQISADAHLPFSPEVVQLVLPYGNIIFHGIEGEVTPPTADFLPNHTLLCYGSSITHGSLALASPYTYPLPHRTEAGARFPQLRLCRYRALRPRHCRMACLPQGLARGDAGDRHQHAGHDRG